MESDSHLHAEGHVGEIYRLLRGTRNDSSWFARTPWAIAEWCAAFIVRAIRFSTPSSAPRNPASLS